MLDVVLFGEIVQGLCNLHEVLDKVLIEADELKKSTNIAEVA